MELVRSSRTCLFPGCSVKPYEKGLCLSHHMKWVRAGKPDLTDWCSIEERHVEQAPPEQVSEDRKSLAYGGCRVPDCTERYFTRNLCHTHYHRWRMSGYADPGEWISGGGHLPSDRAISWCRIEGCPKKNEIGGFCRTHYEQWRLRGRSDSETPPKEHVRNPPKKQEPKKKRRCCVVGCKRKYYAKQLCSSHYRKWLRCGRPNLDTWRKNPVSNFVRQERGCLIDGCTSPHGAKGLCRRHYRKWLHCGRPSIETWDPNSRLRQPKKVGCRIDGCEGRYQARGLCRKHYQQWSRDCRRLGRSLDPTSWNPSGLTWPAKYVGCRIDGCQAEHRAKGFCTRHYQQWRGDRRRLNLDLAPETWRPEYYPSFRGSGRRPTRVGCRIDDCSGVHLARGFCVKHYDQWYRACKKANQHLDPETWNPSS